MCWPYNGRTTEDDNAVAGPGYHSFPILAAQKYAGFLAAPILGRAVDLGHTPAKLWATTPGVSMREAAWF